MKLRIALATITGCMALTACAGNNQDNTLNADDNLMSDMNAGMTDLNTTDMNATDANSDMTNTTNTM